MSVVPLVRLVDRGDGAGIRKEGRTFVSRGTSLWFIHRSSNRQFLWSWLIVGGIVPSSELFGDSRRDGDAVIPLSVLMGGELGNQRRVLLERGRGSTLAVRTHRWPVLLEVGKQRLVIFRAPARLFYGSRL